MLRIHPKKNGLWNLFFGDNMLRRNVRAVLFGSPDHRPSPERTSFLAQKEQAAKNLTIPTLDLCQGQNYTGDHDYEKKGQDYY
jgi:hypothetical protein